MNNLENVRRLYIFVDTTNAFSREGLLADPYVLHTVPELVSIAKIAITDEKGKLMFIIDFHTKDSVEFDRYPKHSVEGTKEVKVISELETYSEVYQETTVYNDYDTNVKEDTVFSCVKSKHSLISAILYLDYFDQKLKERVEKKEEREKLRTLCLRK